MYKHHFCGLQAVRFLLLIIQLATAARFDSWSAPDPGGLQAMITAPGGLQAMNTVGPPDPPVECVELFGNPTETYCTWIQIWAWEAEQLEHMAERERNGEDTAPPCSEHWFDTLHSCRGTEVLQVRRIFFRPTEVCYHWTMEEGIEQCLP